MTVYASRGLKYELPEGHVELVRHYRVGPNGDEKDFDAVQGRLVAETALTYTLEIDGAHEYFPKQIRENGIVTLKGWIEARRG